jgi:hypothetical protein
LHPQQRGANDIHSPLRGLLDYTSPIKASSTYAAGLLNNKFDDVVNTIKQLTGIDLSTVVALTDDIAVALHFGDAAAWTTWFNNVIAFFNEVDFLSPTFDPQAAWNTFATDFLEPFGIVLTPSSPIDASKIFGQIFPWLIGPVPQAAVTSATQNVLWNPGFNGPSSLSGVTGAISWDGTVYYTDPADPAPPASRGSAKYLCDGYPNAIRSNPIAVAADQTVAITVEVAASADIVSTGTPIQLWAIPYVGTAEQPHVLLGQWAPPTGATTNWTGLPAGAHAGQYSVTYPPTGPLPAGVSTVKIRVAVDGTATTGTVWWSGAKADVLGGVIATIQSDMNDLSAEQAAGATAFQTMINSWETTLANGSLSFSTKLSQMEAAWSTYQQTAQDVASAEVITIGSIINGLLNWNTTTGMLPPTSVAAVGAGANLGSDVSTNASALNQIGDILTGGSVTAINTAVANVIPGSIASAAHGTG